MNALSMRPARLIPASTAGADADDCGATQRSSGTIGLGRVLRRKLDGQSGSFVDFKEFATMDLRDCPSPSRRAGLSAMVRNATAPRVATGI
jgi:hypothetical protein